MDFNGEPRLSRNAIRVHSRSQVHQEEPRQSRRRRSRSPAAPSSRGSSPAPQFVHQFQPASQPSRRGGGLTIREQVREERRRLKQERGREGIHIQNVNETGEVQTRNVQLQIPAESMCMTAAEQ